MREWYGSCELTFESLFTPGDEKDLIFRDSATVRWCEGHTLTRLQYSEFGTSKGINKVYIKRERNNSKTSNGLFKRYSLPYLRIYFSIPDNSSVGSLLKRGFSLKSKFSLGP